MTAHDYTIYAVTNLCDILNIDKHTEGRQKQLEPWAPLLEPQ